MGKDNCLGVMYIVYRGEKKTKKNQGRALGVLREDKGSQSYDCYVLS